MSSIVIKKDGSAKVEVTANKNMRDYSDDPYFVKKAEKAVESLKKYGLPKL